MAQAAANGICSLPTVHTVDETIRRLKENFSGKGITLFAEIDHSGEAAKVGMTMPPTKVLIFGSPAAGTPLMLSAPSTALDLPLKLLIAEQADGQVLLSWNDPAYLQERHGFPSAQVANIAAVAKLAAAAAS